MVPIIWSGTSSSGLTVTLHSEEANRIHVMSGHRARKLFCVLLLSDHCGQSQANMPAVSKAYSSPSNTRIQVSFQLNPCQIALGK